MSTSLGARDWSAACGLPAVPVGARQIVELHRPRRLAPTRALIFKLRGL